MHGSLGPQTLVAIFRLAVDSIVDSARHALGMSQLDDVIAAAPPVRHRHLRLVTTAPH
ncbi:MAG TPA: hypothetical protein VH142_17435 [Polyangiaceae bacterium]|nr:hypothetical protein [Polyangiaceae bacterium]